MENNINFQSLSDDTLWDLYYNQNSTVIRELACAEMHSRNLWELHQSNDDDEGFVPSIDFCRDNNY